MNIRLSKNWWIPATVTLVLLAIVLAVTTALAEPAGVDLAAPAGGSAANMFSYQGRLLDGGVPATGTYDFEVTIWDTSSPSGNQVATCPGIVDDISVQDGIFTLYLNPDQPMQQVFSGDERWLRIGVRPGASTGAYTDLGYQPLSPTPYAWGLRVPALISGTTGTLGGFGNAILNIDNTRELYGGGDTSALYARASTGAAVRGESGGVGVYGYSTATHAVRGVSIGGTAGHFVSSGGYGVYGETSSPMSWHHGGYFSATSGRGVQARSEYNEGIRAESGSIANTWRPTSKVGATGLGEDVGVWGSGDWGVVGKTAVSGTYAGYFYDDVYIGGKLDIVGVVDPIIAEGFPADPGVRYEAGDVLCLDAASDYVLPCSRANDTGVVGVVEDGVVEEGEILVVIMGHRAPRPQPGPAETEPAASRSVVRVKADASYGPIQRGDLLASSPTPGYAMKAEPVCIEGVEFHRPGTIIGKAMEPLAGGEGLIEIFVTLQ